MQIFATYFDYFKGEKQGFGQWVLPENYLGLGNPARDARPLPGAEPWRRNIWVGAPEDYPYIGPYDSLDPEIMRWHIRCAKAAGINGFFLYVLEWEERKATGNRQVKQLLDIATQEKDFFIGFVDHYTSWGTAILDETRFLRRRDLAEELPPGIEPPILSFKVDGAFLYRQLLETDDSIQEWRVTPQGVGPGRVMWKYEGGALEFSSDGRWLASRLPGSVGVWDTRDGNLFRTFSVPGDVIEAGFSAEGDILAVVLSDGRVLRWTLKDGQRLPEHQLKGVDYWGWGGFAMWPIPGGFRIFVHRNPDPGVPKYQLEQYTLIQSLTRNWTRQFELDGENELGQIKPVDEGVWVKAIDRGKTVLLLISPEGKILRRMQVLDKPAWIEFDIGRRLVAVHYRFQPCPGSREKDRERPLCVRLLKLSSGEEVGWILTALLPAGSDEEGYPDVCNFMFTPDENFLVLDTYLNLSGD